LDDILKAMGYEEDCRATVSAAEILTVAVVAARSFQNHQQRALCILQRLGDKPKLYNIFSPPSTAISLIVRRDYLPTYLG
jgi:hypothetical protein